MPMPSTSSSPNIRSNNDNPMRSTWICPLPADIQLPETAFRHHTHRVAPNQCCSAAVQTIDAPKDVVWSVIRRFDSPHAYKHFLKSCRLVSGDGGVGSMREVTVVSGIPAGSSLERLEILDDEELVMSFSVVGGDHRLRNYISVSSVHEAPTKAAAVVVESYVVDVPYGNTVEETVAFVDTIVKCNLQSLAHISADLVVSQ
ncbi:hypothetical protein M569_06944 [Genlisea aurea]|uniref:Abscisic acid receptor PYL4 n=1 Tax=Genlisea aurea TaxID=192259 RepID=S8DX50_9LAMI|nr:hypothetical protein M569_06944 [Genlisea aurea]